jgi:hypothetical protein
MGPTGWLLLSNPPLFIPLSVLYMVRFDERRAYSTSWLLILIPLERITSYLHGVGNRQRTKAERAKSQSQRAPSNRRHPYRYRGRVAVFEEIQTTRPKLK